MKSQNLVFNDKEYSSFPLFQIHPDMQLPADLYLFIGGKFLRYKEKDDLIPSDKYDFFLHKKIQFLFCLVADLSKFSQWHEEFEKNERSNMIDVVGLQHELVVDMHRGIKDEFLNFVTQDITDQSAKALVDKTKNFAQELSKKKSVSTLIQKLLSKKPTLADHSQNVANLSIFLALNIGYGQQMILENIYIGALLHDYGKISIEQKYFENPNSPESIEQIKKHTKIGKNALVAQTTFTEEILKIVEEHHEQHDGKGYPKGLKGGRIYDLTKIVSIANYFDNLVSKFDGDFVDAQVAAIKVLEGDNGKMFDPKILEKCLKALKFVV
jgi:putative nucleotidyltransferase with HDIG domain